MFEYYKIKKPSFPMIHFNYNNNYIFCVVPPYVWVTIEELGNEALKCQKEIILPYCHVLIFKWFSPCYNSAYKYIVQYFQTIKRSFRHKNDRNCTFQKMKMTIF